MSLRNKSPNRKLSDDNYSFPVPATDPANRKNERSSGYQQDNNSGSNLFNLSLITSKIPFMKSSFKDSYEKINLDDQDAFELQPTANISSGNQLENQEIELGIRNGTSSRLKAVLNFTNSIVGAGVIGLPFALKESGLLTGIVMMLFLTFVVDWTICLLLRVSKIAGRSTYQDLMEFAFGRRGLLLISFFQFSFAFGAMCAYTVIIGDTLPQILHALIPQPEPSLQFLLSRRFLVAASTLLVLLPLSLFRDISKLSKFSAIALFSLCFIFIAILNDGGTSVKIEWWIQPETFLRATGVISFAFVCHHNSFLIYASLKQPSLNHWDQVTHFSTGISCLISLFISVAGYLTYGDLTKANVLRNISSTHAAGEIWAWIAKIGFVINLYTTYPLELFVCREVLISYLFPKSLNNHFLSTVVTVLLILSTLTVGLMTCQLGLLLELTGCFSAAGLAYILPPALYLKLSGKTLQWTSLKVKCLICLLFGVILMIWSTVWAVIGALENTEEKNCGW